MRIGYLVPEWPGQTHAFFWRELSALRALGHTVFPFSTRRPPHSDCLHLWAAEARATTHYVFPPRVGAVAGVLAARPKGAAAALSYALSLSESSITGRLKVAALIGCAADLVAKSNELALDHLHVHSCANAAHIAAMACLLGGPGYSLTLHGDLPVYGTDHAQKMRRARFVSVVTRPLKQQVMSATGMPEQRVPVVWMGVDTERFKPSEKTLEESATFTIVTVARLNATKGHKHALAAITRLRDIGINIHYLIAGDGPHRAQIERDIADLNLSDAVTLLGTCSEDDVLALLQRANAFVLPSWGFGEAAPVSVMEAMSCAIPVVCSRIGGTEDMITDNETGLLVGQRDIVGLTQALESLVRRRELCLRLGEAARRKAIDAFDYRDSTSKIASAFESRT